MLASGNGASTTYFADSETIPSRGASRYLLFERGQLATDLRAKLRVGSVTRKRARGVESVAYEHMF